MIEQKRFDEERECPKIVKSMQECTKHRCNENFNRYGVKFRATHIVRGLDEKTNKCEYIQIISIYSLNNKRIIHCNYDEKTRRAHAEILKKPFLYRGFSAYAQGMSLKSNNDKIVMDSLKNGECEIVQAGE
jgi:hypothetical protein